MKKIILFMLAFAITCILAAQKIDINKATLSEIYELPITKQQAEDIYNYRQYISFFKSIYQLREIESIDQKTLNKLKPLIIVSHYDEKDAAAQRREEIAYLMERLGNNEGLQEGMSDVWEDYLMSPKNVNKLHFRDLLNMPNVSSIDAAAILKRRARDDLITSYRDLRKTPGISYYGASNLNHYVYYEEEPTPKKLFFDYQFKYHTRPFEDDVQEMYKEAMIRYEFDYDQPSSPTTKKQTYWGYFNMFDYDTEIQNKLRIRYGNKFKSGFLYTTDKATKNLLDINAEDFTDNSKYFLGYEDNFLQNHNLKIILGNYRATFGEGLVMENTDFFKPRKTGYSFDKTIKGIIGDLSTTQEYALNGGAIEWKHPRFNATLFLSKDKKDAVVFDSNGDGFIDEEDDVFSYITLTHRFTNSELREVENYWNNFEQDGQTNYNIVKIAPRLDALEEKLIGGHLEFSPYIGSHIGFTGYEAVYDRHFNVYQPFTNDYKDLRYLLIDNTETAQEKFKLPDNEISASYSTKSSKYGYIRDYRRVVGFDWQTVLNNTSFKGEYAELEVTGSNFKIGDDPKALILSSYSQFENFHFLTIYRDYDLEFDNPYSRPFAESQRFDDTIFEKLTYGLNNTLLNDLYNNSAQASAEEGIYFQTRYQFNRYFTLSKAYLDIWERKSDARKNYRFEGTLQFRPIHALRFSTRYKNQLKRYDDTQERSKSQTDETTLKIRCYLPNFDQLQLEYRYSRTLTPPYVSLANPAEAGGADMAQADVLFNGDYINTNYTHNFNDKLKIKGSFMFWQGNHWDFEDVNLDFIDDEGFKYWFNIHSSISNNIYLSLKFGQKQYKTHEIEYRLYNEIPEEGEYYYRRVKRTDNFLRLQIDGKF